MTSNDVKAARKHALKWLKIPHTRRELYDEPRKLILERIDNAIRNDLRIPAEVFLRMEMISNFLGMSADDQGGWEDLHRSFLYRQWSLRIISGYQDTGQSKSAMDIWNSVLGFAHALAVREDSCADWQGPELLNSLAGKNAKYRGWKDRHFEMFAVHLYATLRKLPIKVDASIDGSLGVYQEVFDHWHDNAQLATTLVKLCEHHWEETFDDKLDHIGAFAWAPYAIFPVELIAIRRVREDLGLATPSVDHPLMQTPLAFPPNNMPNVKDEVLDQVIAKARAEGIVGDPW